MIKYKDKILACCLQSNKISTGLQKLMSVKVMFIIGNKLIWPPPKKSDWLVLHWHLAWNWAPWWVWKQTVNRASWRSLFWMRSFPPTGESKTPVVWPLRLPLPWGSLTGWFCWCHSVCSGQQCVNRPEVNECGRWCLAVSPLSPSIEDREDSQRHSWVRSRVPHWGFGSAAVAWQTKNVPV